MKNLKHRIFSLLLTAMVILCGAMATIPAEEIVDYEPETAVPMFILPFRHGRD